MPGLHALAFVGLVCVLGRATETAPERTVFELPLRNASDIARMDHDSDLEMIMRHEWSIYLRQLSERHNTTPRCLRFLDHDGAQLIDITEADGEDKLVAITVPHCRHLDNNRPLCSVNELGNGLWMGMQWLPYGDCQVTSLQQSLLQVVKEDVAILWSGNSVTRHQFFRAAELFRAAAAATSRQGEIRKDWMPAKGSVEHYDREREKALCKKNITFTGKLPPEAFKYRKAFCGTDCCGVCSCSAEVASVQQNFIWQQEWFDPPLRRIWDAALELELSNPRRVVYLVINAGLIKVIDERMNVFRYMEPQVKAFASWLENLDRRVRVILKGSTYAKFPRGDDFLNGCMMAADQYMLQQIR